MSYNARVAEFWDAVKSRLATSRMEALLQGPDRIYVGTDDFEDAEGGEDAAWGRLVILPVNTLWAVPEQFGGLRRVQFLVRAEVNNFQGAGYNPLRALEGVHDEAYGLLEHWTPTGFADVLIAVHVYRYAPPDAMPMWDDTRNVWMLSAEYRTEVAATVPS